MSRPLRGAAAAFIGVAAWSLVACEDDIDIPRGPNMTPLVDEYDNPSGTLTQTNVKRVADAALAAIDNINRIGALDFVIDTVEATQDTIEDFATPDGDPDPDIGGTVKINGIARTHTICPGLIGELDEAENGSLSINVPFQESELSPVLFGTFNDCTFRVARREGGVPTEPVNIDSSVAAYIGSGVHFDLQGLTSVLYSLQGKAKAGVRPAFDLNASFRSFTDGRIEVSIDVADGNVVPFVYRNSLQGGVLTRDVDYCCDFEERACIQTTSSNADCTEPATGDRVLRW